MQRFGRIKEEEDEVPVVRDTVPSGQVAQVRVRLQFVRCPLMHVAVLAALEADALLGDELGAHADWELALQAGGHAGEKGLTGREKSRYSVYSLHE